MSDGYLKSYIDEWLLDNKEEVDRILGYEWDQEGPEEVEPEIDQLLYLASYFINKKIASEILMNCYDFFVVANFITDEEMELFKSILMREIFLGLK